MISEKVAFPKIGDFFAALRGSKMCGPRSKISDRLSSRTRLVFLLGRSSPDLLLSGWCFPSAPNSCSTLAALTLIDLHLHHFSPQSLLVFVSSAALLQIPFFFSLRSRLSQARVSKAVSLKARCKTLGKDPQLYPPATTITANVTDAEAPAE